jgi:hypothetical protein
LKAGHSSELAMYLFAWLRQHLGSKLRVSRCPGVEDFLLRLQKHGDRDTSVLTKLLSTIIRQPVLKCLPFVYCVQSSEHADGHLVYTNITLTSGFGEYAVVQIEPTGAAQQSASACLAEQLVTLRNQLPFASLLVGAMFRPSTGELDWLLDEQSGVLLLLEALQKCVAKC